MGGYRSNFMNTKFTNNNKPQQIIDKCFFEGGIIFTMRKFSSVLLFLESFYENIEAGKMMINYYLVFIFLSIPREQS